MVSRGFVKPEDQEPEIDGFEFYIDAFRELSTCRPGGMDLQPIPFTAIAEYSRIYQLGDFDDFAAIIRAMDNLFMSMNSEAQERAGKRDATNNKSGPKNNHKY